MSPYDSRDMPYTYSKRHEEPVQRQLYQNPPPQQPEYYYQEEPSQQYGEYEDYETRPQPYLPKIEETENMETLNSILKSIADQQDKMMASIGENVKAIENLRDSDLNDTSSYFNRSQSQTLETISRKSRLNEHTLSSMAKRKAKANKFLRVSPARVQYNKRRANNS